MALILSIETSTTVCSVAVTREEEVIASKKLFQDRSHSTHLTLTIESVIGESGTSLKDLDAIAVSKGPGSYTGLRIGVSTAKGLCYTLDKPLIAINTLKAMAHEVNQNNDSGRLLCPMIDARRMEVYTALYNDGMIEVEPTSAKVLDDLSFSETLRDESVLFFGNGSNKFSELIGDKQNARFVEDISPSAFAVGQLAYDAYKKSEFEDVAYFEPYYLKDFIATVPKKLL